MKKLKIFLLLSILLCFGFALSPEVHAQGGGPKIFEVGDVLPAGKVLFNGYIPLSDTYGTIWMQIGNDADEDESLGWNKWGLFQLYDDYLVGDNIIDFSSFSEHERTVYGVRFVNIADPTLAYMTWEEYIEGYSITFEENGGTSVTDLSEQTTLPNPLPTTTKTGYTFIGWYYDSDFTNEALAGDPLTGDVTLYAKWELNTYTYTITFEENGGTSVTDLSEQTTLPNPLPTTTKTGYTFIGWYYDSDFTNEALAGDPLTGDVTLYAKWELNTYTYTITFEENGGTSVTDLSEQTTLPNPLPIPTKENHIFHGWYYDSDFTNRAFPGDPLTTDVTLYAKWGLAGSPKFFEIGDVLPAEIIKLHVFLYNYGDFYEPQTTIYFNDTNWIAFNGAEDDGHDVTPYVDINTNLSSNYIIIDDSHTYYEGSYYEGPRDEYMYAEIIIDFSNCSLAERTVSSIDVSSIHGGINPSWEVVSSEDPIEDPSIIYDDLYNLYNGEALDIELGYILPAAKIAINLVYNNTGGQDDGMIVYTFGTYGRIALTAFEDMSPYTSETQAVINVIVLDDNWNMNILHDSLASQGFGSTRGILSAGMIIDLTDASEEERTITGIIISSISDSRIEMDCIFSRILSIDESIYQEGYSDGYSEGREIYGYYDPNTEEWLSVDEYLELYGEKMSSSNFYANFDKYFIPAMIIIFGGAIVLTVLKVFKGRE